MPEICKLRYEARKNLTGINIHRTQCFLLDLLFILMCVIFSSKQFPFFYHYLFTLLSFFLLSNLSTHSGQHCSIQWWCHCLFDILCYTSNIPLSLIYIIIFISRVRAIRILSHTQKSIHIFIHLCIHKKYLLSLCIMLSEKGLILLPIGICF